MKYLITALVMVFVMLIGTTFFYVAVAWNDISQRYDTVEKRLTETQEELRLYRQEVETYHDILINKRWD